MSIELTVKMVDVSSVDFLGLTQTSTQRIFRLLDDRSLMRVREVRSFTFSLNCEYHQDGFWFTIETIDVHAFLSMLKPNFVGVAWDRIFAMLTLKLFVLVPNSSREST